MNEKILVIDDDKEILFAISAICEYKNWIPITASNVIEGIEKYENKKPDIILMDYHLPVISGIEGVKRLRKIDKTTPIIVLTIEEDQKVADRFMEVGASDFALKPIKAPDIISRINVHIRLKKTIESSNKETDDYTKGISNETLEIIKNFMERENIYYSIDEISGQIDLAYQTVHRYLQHMENKKMVEISYKYGKVGRPQKLYRITKDK